MSVIPLSGISSLPRADCAGFHETLSLQKFSVYEVSPEIEIAVMAPANAIDMLWRLANIDGARQRCRSYAKYMTRFGVAPYYRSSRCERSQYAPRQQAGARQRVEASLKPKLSLASSGGPNSKIGSRSLAGMDLKRKLYGG